MNESTTYIIGLLKPKDSKKSNLELIRVRSVY